MREVRVGDGWQWQSHLRVRAGIAEHEVVSVFLLCSGELVVIVQVCLADELDHCRILSCEEVAPEHPV